uniref:ribosomal protein S11 n=1 Tax=Carex alatauensis TaxID=544729 RepID=UPI001F129974|nr:ribosomal protein S11 [Carex alatauensis]UKU08167.1 ribosomal protein S11 [Carex alatauensis]
MKKPKRRISPPRMNRRLSSKRFRLLRTIRRKIKKGLIHIQASSNNTIITVSDFEGQVVSWDSAGTSRFKGPKKPTPYAAQTATRNAIYMLVKQGMKEAAIKINGAGPGRAAALKSVVHSGVKLSFIRDVTPLPHNGCRPPKRRRV